MRGNNDVGKGGGIHEVKIFGGLDSASFIHSWSWGLSSCLRLGGSDCVGQGEGTGDKDEVSVNDPEKSSVVTWSTSSIESEGGRWEQE